MALIWMLGCNVYDTIIWWKYLIHLSFFCIQYHVHPRNRVFFPFHGFTLGSYVCDMCILLLQLFYFFHTKVNGVFRVFIFTLWREIISIILIDKVFKTIYFKFSVRVLVLIDIPYYFWICMKNVFLHSFPSSLGS